MIKYDKTKKIKEETTNTDDMKVGDTGILLGKFYAGTPVIKVFNEHNSPQSAIISLTAGNVTWSKPTFPVRLCDFELKEDKNHE